ncbi:MAG: CARDB domain-containing protein [Geodermatophilaceae bacterium]
MVFAGFVARTELRSSAGTPTESLGSPTAAGKGTPSLPGVSSSGQRTSGGTGAPPTGTAPRSTTGTATATIGEPLAAPARLQAFADKQGGVTLTWSPSTDQRVVSYQVFRSGELVQETSNTTWLDGPGAGIHSYAVRATDGVGSFSPLTEPLTVEVAEPLALPDLVVDLSQGADGVFVTVTNIGDASAPQSIVDLFGGDGGAVDIKSLDAGDTSAAIQVNDCVTNATVDPANVIAEESEDNNASQTLPSCPD